MRTPAGHRLTMNLSVAGGLGLARTGREIGRSIVDPLIVAERQANEQADTRGILKTEPKRSTLRCLEHAGQWWVLKRYHVSRLRTGVLSLVGQTPIQRETRGANWLIRHGRRGNPPLATVLQKPLDHESQLLILPYLDGLAADQLVHATWDRTTQRPTRAQVRIGQERVEFDASSRLTLAWGIGRQVGQLLKAGVVNRDHKLSNLIVDRHCLDGDEPIIIDPVGLRWWRNRGQVLRMFAMLIRTTHRDAGFTTREGLRFLQAVLDAQPTLGHGLDRPTHDLGYAALALFNNRSKP